MSHVRLDGTWPQNGVGKRNLGLLRHASILGANGRFRKRSHFGQKFEALLCDNPPVRRILGERGVGLTAFIGGVAVSSLLACSGQSPSSAGLESGVAQRAVESQRASLESCNDGEEEKALEVRIDVAPSGEVERVQARGSAELGPCVERAVRNWEFPAAAGPTEIELPVTFAATNP